MKLDTSLHGIFSLVSITLFVFYIIAKCIHIVNDVNTSANGTLTSHYRKVMFYHNLFFFANILHRTELVNEYGRL